MSQKNDIISFINNCVKNNNSYDIFVMNLANKSITRRVYNSNPSIAENNIKVINTYNDDLIDPSMGFQIVTIRLHSDEPLNGDNRPHLIYVPSGRMKYNYNLDEWNSEI